MGNLLGKVLGDSFIYAVLPRLSRLASIFIMPFITRYLTPYDYGVVGILFAYVNIFEGFSSLGLDVVFINSFFKQGDAYLAIWKKLYGFLTVWAFPYGFLITLTAYTALPAGERHQFWDVIVCVIFPIVFFDRTIDVGQKYLQMNRRPFPFSMISLVASLLVLVSEYFTIVNLRMGFMGFLVSDFLGKVFSFFCYSYLVWTRIKIFPDFRLSYSVLRPLLAIGIPTIPHAYAAYILNTSDRLLLDLFKISVPLVGLYSFAYSFATNFSKIGQSMLIAGRPVMMGLFAEGKLESEIKARNLIWVLQAGLLSFGFLISLWIKEIIYFLASNEALRDAYVYAPVIIMAYTYYPIYFGAINKLYYHEKTRIFWKISFLATMINLGLNLVLIPLLNVWGAVVSTFVSYLFMGYSAYIQVEFRKINTIKYREVLWLSCTILLTLLVFFIKDINIYFKSGFSLVLLFAWGITGIYYKMGKHNLQFS